MARFDADMGALGLLPAWSEPRATSAIPDILSLIGAVLDSGPRLPVRGGRCTSTSRPSAGSATLSHLDRGEMLALAAEQRRQSRGPQQTQPARLRPLAAVATRRAVLGVALGTRPPGLAHRVLGPGPARARGDGRRARRRPGPGLPPPRVRDGPVRVGHRPAVRPPLAARRPGRAGRREDVQVARQPGLRGRPPEGVGAGGRPPGPARPTTTARTGSGRPTTCPGGRPARARGGAVGPVEQSLETSGDDPALDAVRPAPRRRPRHARRAGRTRRAGQPAARPVDRGRPSCSALPL